MVYVRHLQLTLKSASEVKAHTWRTFPRSRTKVYIKISYMNICYTSPTMIDMGQNPVWEDDGTNVFHFDFEDESHHILLELFNRSNDCIGASKLFFVEILHKPEHEFTLPVMASNQQYGKLVLQTQMKVHQAMGNHGLLELKLVKGHCKKLTSLFSSTPEICAKLIYKNTTYTSGIIKDMGNTFVWQNNNICTFPINSLDPDDKVNLQVYNRSKMVGECEMSMMSLTEKQEAPKRTEKLSLEGKPVGEITLMPTFPKAAPQTIPSNIPSMDTPSTSIPSAPSAPSAPPFDVQFHRQQSRKFSIPPSGTNIHRQYSRNNPVQPQAHGVSDGRNLQDSNELDNYFKVFCPNY